MKWKLQLTAKNLPHNHYFFHTVFEAWVARCSPNSDLGRPQKCSGTAVLKVTILHITDMTCF